MPAKAGLIALVALGLAACTPDETVTAYGGAGTWALTEIAGEEASGTLTLGPDGAVTGVGPCNRFTARQTAPYPWFELTPLAITKIACPDLEAEQRYVQALSDAAVAEVSGDTLLLSTDTGLELVFRRQP
ncbi:META domain-containing protein [Aestuariibius insulae]|uniref:META domain-containing protein n=1 Tax=Aestuariibius insulae TaxID=2058287 RepID=UPI00345E44C7